MANQVINPDALASAGCRVRQSNFVWCGRVLLCLAIAVSAYFAAFVGYYAVDCGTGSVGMAIVGAIGLALLFPEVAGLIFMVVGFASCAIVFGFFGERRQLSSLWSVLLIPAVGLLSFLACSLVGATPRCSLLW